MRYSLVSASKQFTAPQLNGQRIFQMNDDENLTQLNEWGLAESGGTPEQSCPASSQWRSASEVDTKHVWKQEDEVDLFGCCEQRDNWKQWAQDFMKGTLLSPRVERGTFHGWREEWIQWNLANSESKLDIIH